MWKAVRADLIVEAWKDTLRIDNSFLHFENVHNYTFITLLVSAAHSNHCFHLFVLTQWNWSSPGMRSGDWRKPPTLFWLRASTFWLTERIITSPCCCTLMKHSWSWNSWQTTPSSVFSIKRPFRGSQHSPTPCKLLRGTACLLHCTALHDPVSTGCLVELL